MSKHRVLGFKPQLRLEWRGQDGQHETQQPDHSASLGDSITSLTRIRFSVRTRAKDQFAGEEISSAALVRAYRQEIGRQQLIARKADLAQARLVFIVNALKTLLNERMFASLHRTCRTCHAELLVNPTDTSATAIAARRADFGKPGTEFTKQIRLLRSTAPPRRGFHLTIAVQQ
jgi:hypothetical protein